MGVTPGDVATGDREAVLSVEVHQLCRQKNPSPHGSNFGFHLSRKGGTSVHMFSNNYKGELDNQEGCPGIIIMTWPTVTRQQIRGD